MGRYFINLAYNGAAYNGWQTQPGLPTVQLTLEEALSTLLRQKIAVVGCGRTDTGVHASDFYAHFDVSISCKRPSPAVSSGTILSHLLPSRHRKDERGGAGVDGI